MSQPQEIEDFKVELIDRFGPIPEEVQNLFDVVEIKHLCRTAQIEKVEAGPKGAIVTFYQNKCDYVDALLAYIGKNAGLVKLRPEDQKLVFMRSWPDIEARTEGVRRAVSDLAKLAKENLPLI